MFFQAIRWLNLLVGVAFFQGILTFSPIPETQDLEQEWIAFNQRLEENPNFRLPVTTKPIHYVVSLTPYLPTLPTTVDPRHFTFDGTVAITLTAVEGGANEIVLHCNDLTISTLTVSYVNADGGNVDITAANQQFVCDAVTSFLTVATTEPLVADREYTLSSTFTGNLQTNMRGFYRSWYKDSTSATNGLR